MGERGNGIRNPLATRLVFRKSDAQLIKRLYLSVKQTQVFSAWPISNLWNLRNGYLFNYGAFITAFAAMDIALDIIILCLPIPVIRGLNMSTRRKFTLVGIFWLGAL